jgi:hypothetical protein
MSNGKNETLPVGSEIAKWGRPTATFESFDWAAAPSLDKAVFDNLATCAFIARGQNVIFSGPTASGKTHLANALEHVALQAGHTVNVINADRLDARFSWQFVVDQYLSDCDLLVIDEPRPTEQLRALLKARRGRSTILVSDVPSKVLFEAVLPPSDRSLEPLRASWADHVAVEFKENTYGLSLRKGS